MLALGVFAAKGAAESLFTAQVPVALTVRLAGSTFFRPKAALVRGIAGIIALTMAVLKTSSPAQATVTSQAGLAIFVGIAGIPEGTATFATDVILPTILFFLAGRCAFLRCPVNTALTTGTLCLWATDLTTTLRALVLCSASVQAGPTMQAIALDVDTKAVANIGFIDRAGGSTAIIDDPVAVVVEVVATDLLPFG